MKNNRTFACSVVVLFILSTGLSALATAQDKTAQNIHDPEARLNELGIVLPPAPLKLGHIVALLDIMAECDKDAADINAAAYA